ncbi:MAG: hypothetical protein QM791_04215 [Ferruginibacter sp.]
MENNKLTQEEIAKIFASHLMCDIQAPNPYAGDECQPDMATGYLTGISAENSWQAQIQFVIDGNAEEEPAYEDVDKCKLLLRRLESISDEDIIEVAGICSFGTDGMMVQRIDKVNEKYIMVCDKYNDNADEKNSLRIYYEQFEIIFLDEEGRVSDFDWYRMIEVTDLLRSKGYALPYRGIDLFESGIAIEKKG